MRWSLLSSVLLPVAVSSAPANLGLFDFCFENALIILELGLEPGGISFCLDLFPSLAGPGTVTETYTPTVHATETVTETGDANTVTITASATKDVETTVFQTATKIFTNTVTSTSTAAATCLTSGYTLAAPTTAKAGALQDRGLIDGLTIPTCIPTGWGIPTISQACSCACKQPVTVTQTAPAATQTTTQVVVIHPNAQATITDVITVINTATQTKTVSSTTTLTAKAVITTAAGANGLRYRRYSWSGSTAFSSSDVKGKTPEYQGNLTNVDFACGGGRNCALPDKSPAFDPTNSAILMQGFFLAKETGTYNFSSNGNQIDDYGYLWLGDVAYSEWNDSNANLVTQYQGTPKCYYCSYTIQVTAGQAVPFTWLWANGGGPGASYLGITSPSGVFTDDTSEYFVLPCSAAVFP